MKKNLLIVALLIGVLFLVGFQTSKPQYEYKFVNQASEKKANELAALGYELVAVDSSTENVPTYIFKRTKP